MEDWIRDLIPNFFSCASCGSLYKIRKSVRRNSNMEIILFCQKEENEIKKIISFQLAQTLVAQFWRSMP